METNDEVLKPALAMQRLPKDGAHRWSAGPRQLPLILLPASGFLALVWFLIRVVPKPSRAAYPCQRVAAPLAGSFLVWLAGIGGGKPGFPPGADLAAAGALCRSQAGSAGCRGGNGVGGVGPGTIGAGRAGCVHAAPCQRADWHRQGIDAGPGRLGVEPSSN
jgi:hypothetical protein